MEARKILLKELLGLTHFVFLYLEEREREAEGRREEDSAGGNWLCRSE